MLTLYRLQPDDEASWKFWPTFRRRVQRFLTIWSPEFSARQMRLFLKELDNRFVNQAEISGFWLMLGETREFPTLGGLPKNVVGHLCSWVQYLYGKPYVLLFQAECDEQWQLRETYQAAMAAAAEWIAQMNAVLIANGDESIDWVEHWSRAPDEVWDRLLPELHSEFRWHVQRFTVGNRPAIGVNGSAPKSRKKVVRPQPVPNDG